MQCWNDNAFYIAQLSKVYRHQEKLLSSLHCQYTPVYKMIIPILPLLNVEQCVVICSNNVIHITFAAWKEIFASSFILSEFKPLFHCIPVLQIVTERGRVFIMLLYMELKVGILVSPCPSLRPSPHYSPCYSPHYGLDAENWECGNILRVISALWLKCGYNAEISPYSCPNTPIRIFSAFFSI